MHPELLRALAKARHQDLISSPRTPAQARVRVDNPAPRFSARDSGWAHFSFGQDHV